MRFQIIKHLTSIISSFFLISIIGAIILKFFFVGSHQVAGGSMADTLIHGDYILSWRLSRPGKSKLQHGDIVVIRKTGEQDALIKRIIGLPGDTIELRQDGIMVNGDYLEEKYTKSKNKYPFRKVYQIKNNQTFVLGDNRQISRDSDDFGPVSTNDVTEKVFLIYYPLNHIKWLP